MPRVHAFFHVMLSKYSSYGIQKSLKLQDAPTYLEPHYGNGVFSKVYLLALNITKRPFALTGVADTLGQFQLPHFYDQETSFNSLH